MRKIFKLMSAIMALMAAAPRAVWDGTRWIMKAAFGPPVGANAGIEAEMEDLSAEAHAIAAAPVPLAAANDDDGLMPLIPFEYDASKDWGLIAKNYFRARVYAKPEPDLSDLDELTEKWMRSLTTDECMRLHGLAPERISSHIFGSHLIRGMAPCHEYNRAYPALVMAEVETPDARHQEILDDLENDPESIPGYRAPRVA